MANTEPQEATSSTLERPVCDEWGLYDPEQAGFEAMVRRLATAEENDETRAGIAFAPSSLGVHSLAVSS